MSMLVARHLRHAILLALVVVGSLLYPFSVSVQPDNPVPEISTSVAYAQTDAAPALANNRNLTCIDLTSFDMEACLAWITYGLFWWPTHFFAEGAARLQDYFIFYSINEGSYRSAFIEEGWRIIRDISNLFFIFALIYIAIAIILDSSVGGISPKKLIVTVIMMALLINFSLFFSRVIVDAGNVLAYTFYRQIAVKKGSGETVEGRIQPIGLAIINISNPLRMINAQTESPIRASAGDARFFLIASFASGVFNIMLIILFISVSIFFIGRVIGLYFLMMFAPFAFASKAFPNAAKFVPQLSFKGWFKEIISLSFMAPIFLFFVYLTARFLSEGIGLIPPPDTTNSTMGTFVSIAIPFAFAYGILQQGKNTAKKMSGEFGGAASKGIAAVAGIGMAVASGGTALIGRKAVGAVASLSNKESLMKKAAAGNVSARLRLRALNKAQKTSFDVRNTSLGSRFIKGVNKDTGGFDTNPAELSMLGMTTQQTKGGREAYLKRKKEEVKKSEESVLLTGDEKADHNAKAKTHNERAEILANRRKEANEIINKFEPPLSPDERKKIWKQILDSGTYTDPRSKEVKKVDDKGAISNVDHPTESKRSHREQYLEENLNRLVDEEAAAIEETGGVADKNKLKEEITNEIKQKGTYKKRQVSEVDGKKKITSTVDTAITNDTSLQGRVADERMKTAEELNADVVQAQVAARRRGNKSWRGRALRTFSNRVGGTAEERALRDLEKKYTGEKSKSAKLADIDSALEELDKALFEHVQEAINSIKNFDGDKKFMENLKGMSAGQVKEAYATLDPQQQKDLLDMTKAYAQAEKSGKTTELRRTVARDKDLRDLQDEAELNKNQPGSTEMENIMRRIASAIDKLSFDMDDYRTLSTSDQEQMIQDFSKALQEEIDTMPEKITQANFEVNRKDSKVNDVDKYESRKNSLEDKKRKLKGEKKDSSKSTGSSSGGSNK